MGTPEVRFEAATRQHLLELAPRMRAGDLAETLAAGFPTAIAGLEYSFAASEIAFAARINGEVAVVWGIAANEVDGALGRIKVGIVWALTSDTVTRFPMTFFRLGKPALQGLLEYCGHLINWIDARYAAALRWVKHLGFEVGEPQPLGPSGELFCFVSLRRL